MMPDDEDADVFMPTKARPPKKAKPTAGRTTRAPSAQVRYKELEDDDAAWFQSPKREQSKGISDAKTATGRRRSRPPLSPIGHKQFRQADPLIRRPPDDPPAKRQKPSVARLVKPAVMAQGPADPALPEPRVGQPDYHPIACTCTSHRHVHAGEADPQPRAERGAQSTSHPQGTPAHAGHMGVCSALHTRQAADPHRALGGQPSCGGRKQGGMGHVHGECKEQHQKLKRKEARDAAEDWFDPEFIPIAAIPIADIPWHMGPHVGNKTVAHTGPAEDPHRALGGQHSCGGFKQGGTGHTHGECLEQPQKRKRKEAQEAKEARFDPEFLPKEIIPWSAGPHVGSKAVCSFPGCQSGQMAKWAWAKGVQRYCPKHQVKGMRDVLKDLPPPNLCAEFTCMKQSCYGPPGEPATRCKTHALDGMINNISAKMNATKAAMKASLPAGSYQQGCTWRCSEPGCGRPGSFGALGNPYRYCKEHKKGGMVGMAEVRRQAKAELPDVCLPEGVNPHIGSLTICSASDCQLIPHYVVAVGGERWCYKHKRDCMLDLRHGQPSRFCAEPFCTTHPFYGEPGCPAKYCAYHAKAGMVNPQVVNRPPSRFCAADGCEITPSWGAEGGPRTHCSAHKLDGMVSCTLKCTEKGCGLVANCYFPGGPRERCAGHKLDGQVGPQNTCLEPDCCKIASWGVLGEGPKWCPEHKLATHVLRRTACEDPDCNTSATFGPKGGKARRCWTHKLPEDVDVRSRRCQSTECQERAFFGPPGMPPERCMHHIVDGYVRSTYSCKQCQLAFSCKDPIRQGFCARCWAIEHPWFASFSERKIRECAVMTALQQEMPLRCPWADWESATYDLRIKGGFSSKRPDFFIRCGAWNVVLECDERQHRGYDTEQEQVRNYLLWLDGGKKPLVILRFNPDEYTQGGVPHESSFVIREVGKESVQLCVRDAKEWSERLNMAFEALEKAMTYPPTEEIQEIFLFFDCP